MSDKVVVILQPIPRVGVVVSQDTPVVQLRPSGLAPKIDVKVASDSQPKIELTAADLVQRIDFKVVSSQGPGGPPGQSVLQAMDIEEGASTPAPSGPGWAWSNQLQRPVYWDGGNWRAVAPVTVSPTPPANPTVGSLWVEL